MSLYYEHICSMIYHNVTNPPNILNNKRIDLVITQKDAEEVQVLDKSQIQMSHQLDAIETEEQMKLIKLIAMSYFYGINGVKQNFQESYRLFNKIHSYKKNNEIISRLAFMNLKGLGTPQVAPRIRSARPHTDFQFSPSLPLSTLAFLLAAWPASRGLTSSNLIIPLQEL